MGVLARARVGQCTGPDLWEKGISGKESASLKKASGARKAQASCDSTQRQKGAGWCMSRGAEGWTTRTHWGAEERGVACPAAPGRQSRCLRVSEQGGLPLPPGPGERRRNKSLHFDGSSSPISSIYSVSIAGAQQQPWQQLPPGSHLLLGCALPSRKENEEGDRERERKRESKGGRVGKEKGKKPC